MYSDCRFSILNTWMRIERCELRLSYEQTVTDPATFTQPATLRGEWVAIPGIEIQPFDMCCSDNAYL